MTSDGTDDVKIKEFIIKAVEEYKSEPMYTKAVEAQEYYARRNIAISQRFGAYEAELRIHIGGAYGETVFHKAKNGIFREFVLQEAQYLLGNGVSLKQKSNKDKLGKRFDRDLQRAGQQSLVDGVNWCYWQAGTQQKRFGRITREEPGRMLVFRATEFCPVLDERTSDLMVGIRFNQIDGNKPTYIEFFDSRGITPYTMDKSASKVEQSGRTTPYIYNKTIFGFGEQSQPVGAVDSDNNPQIPVFPFYANELRESELNDGLKADIDLYDFIISDLGDGITQLEGIYYAITKYGGNDDNVVQMLREIQRLKRTYDSGDANVQMQSLEIPYQAKEYALNMLRNRMYEENMMLDMKGLTGGSLTNVAIQIASTNFDLKTDQFEFCAVELVDNILEYNGIDDVPKFKRRSIVNDSEIIGDHSTQLADGYVDEEWCIDHAPNIDDDEKAALKERIALQQQEAADREYPVGEEEENEDEVQ